MRRAQWLPLAIVLAIGGCAEEELERGSRPSVEAVQLANRDPGPACRGVLAVEVRSGRYDTSASGTLREVAAALGANYVVIDTFSVDDEGDDTPVVTRARLFCCPPLARFAD